MRAAALVDVAQLEIRDVPVQAPGPREALLRVAAVGLCGTDFHIFSGEGNYHTDEHGRPVSLRDHPQVLGHEIVGRVEEVGGDVGDLRPGDLVVVDQGRNCMSAGRPLCEYCATGDSHQCADYREHGITGPPGALAEFITVPAVNTIRVEGDLPQDQLALTEPLACVVHSCDMLERARPRYALKGGERPARYVLIFGGGPAGLLFTQYLRTAVGFEGDVIVAEPNAVKRQLARECGAIVVNPAALDLGEEVDELTDGRRVECVIDAAGAGAVFDLIPLVLRKQGTVVLYGHGHAGADLTSLNRVQFLEPTLVSPVGASGGFGPDGRPLVHRRALDLLLSGAVRVGSFITHRYDSLDQVPDAFAGVHLAPDYVKGVVQLR
jgi:L-iditol 2-dehydrogenase